jgi:hypothetical protein
VIKRLLAAAGLLLVAALSYLFLCCPASVVPSLEPDDQATLRPRAVTAAQQGKALVTAIYAFKNRCGLWPSSLAELVPEYATSETVRGWHYDCHLSGWWQLTHFIDYPGWAVRYERRKDQEGWQLTDGIDGIDLDIQQPKPRPARLPDEDLLERFQAVLRRRMVAEPGRKVHYQGALSWYYRRNDVPEARAVWVRCLELWPDHWWPNVMLAILDARLGSFAKAEHRLRLLMEKNLDLAHWFLFAQFYLGAGEEAKAFATLKRAADLPMRDLECGMYTRDQPLGMMAYGAAWRAALMAYRARRYDIAMAVCDRWERYRMEESRSADQSYYTIRAACHLAQGQFDQARAEAQEMIHLRQYGRHLGNDVEALLGAIDRRDKNFVYESKDGAFEMFVDYE